MAEDLRHDDPIDGGLTAARAALIAECEREEGSCLYTSTSFYIWLRWLKMIRAALWTLGAIGSVASANSILRGEHSYPIVTAALAIAGVLMPGLIKAVQLDATIKEYASAAASFKNLEGEFRRAATVWSNKPLPEFESEARKILKLMNEARKPSLTPPECASAGLRKRSSAATTPRTRSRAASMGVLPLFTVADDDAGDPHGPLSTRRSSAVSALSPTANARARNRAFAEKVS